MSAILGISESLLRTILSFVEMPKPQVITPAASCPNMNDQIHIEREETCAEQTPNVNSSHNGERFDDALTEEEIARFKSKVKVGEGVTDCWLWLGGRFDSGYGIFKMRGKMRRAHRVAFRIHHGVIEEGLAVCHTCDVRSCVRPDHLFLGTNLDNNRDKEAKGRGRRLHGSDNPRAKLVAEDVIEIRALFEQGWTRKAIADKFHINAVHVWHIVHRKTWAHLN